MLDTILTSAIKALPVFAAHFGVTLLILIGGVLIYQALTPQAETRLIRENNVAAATAFGAAILSLALPLAMCLARSVSIPDIIVWGWSHLLCSSRLSLLPRRCSTAWSSASNAVRWRRRSR